MSGGGGPKHDKRRCPGIAGDDKRQKLEFHHVHLELGALGYIEIFLFYWVWVFIQNNPPPWPIFVFENTRDWKNIFLKIAPNHFSVKAIIRIWSHDSKMV